MNTKINSIVNSMENNRYGYTYYDRSNSNQNHYTLMKKIEYKPNTFTEFSVDLVHYDDTSYKLFSSYGDYCDGMIIFLNEYQINDNLIENVLKEMIMIENTFLQQNKKFWKNYTN